MGEANMGQRFDAGVSNKMAPGPMSAPVLRCNNGGVDS